MPDASGTARSRGVAIAYEVFGTTGPWVVFAPVDPIIHSHGWKAQVSYLSRYGRVVTIDAPGNGRSERTLDPAAYGDEAMAEHLLAVMDHLRIDRAAVVGICCSARQMMLAAGRNPDRVAALVSIAGSAPFLTPPHPYRVQYPFDEVPDTDQGWARHTRSYWEKDYRGFLEFFAGELLPEPHSTKLAEDFVDWGMEGLLGAQLVNNDSPMCVSSAEETRALVTGFGCPLLLIHGDDDRCQPLARSYAVAELTGAELVVIEGSGHLPQGRHPVVVNLAIRDFLRRVGWVDGVVDRRPLEGGPVQEAAPAQEAAPVQGGPLPPDHEPVARRGRGRGRRNGPKRVLYLSSPIGLGHARRDLAVARALREQVPGVQIDWLTQQPVTRFLAANGERVHAASRWLASESAVFEECAGEHDLNAFQAVRQMDEILVNNFMVFSDLVEEERYDLWTGDEAWDLDYFLHENPRLKRTAYAWLTDFVGWLPMPDDDPRVAEREAALTADYNADMLEQLGRRPDVRDHSLFVGNPDDVVDASFGPGLPQIRDWVGSQYDFTGYITGFDPGEISDRAELRREFGFGDDEPICVVAVGGSGVGGHLLRRSIEAHHVAAARVPGLRTVVVAGPRIDPSALPSGAGVDVRGFEPALHRMLAASDFAIVQGGLTTTMELTAAGRPFVHVPLRHHFEQNLHVRHRLANYGAGTCLTWDDADPDRLAEVVVAGIGRPVDYRPVETDGAQRAAAALARLL